VPPELLRTIVQAAIWAPTGHNEQAEHFVIVTDRGTIKTIAPMWRRAIAEVRTARPDLAPEHLDASGRWMESAIDYQMDHFEEVPALILACYDLASVERSRRNLGASLAVLRQAGPRHLARMARASFRERIQAACILPAVENLLLAARAHGLGACLTQWHLLFEEELKQLLGIPKSVAVYAVIPVGWPLSSFGPVRRRPVDEFIHMERWSQS
jgi:nitroreductase